MAEKVENLRIRVPITPEFDERGSKRAFADFKKFKKLLEDIQPTWRSIGKQASLNVKEINKISTSAAQLGRRLGQAAKESYKELSELGKRIDAASQKAAELEQQYHSAKGAEKSRLGQEVSKQYKIVKDLNVQLGEQAKKTKRFNTEHSKAIKSHEKVRKDVERSVGQIKTDVKDVGKGFLRSLVSGKGNIAKSLGAALENMGEKAAKHTRTAAGATELAAGGPSMLSKSLGAAAVGLSAAVIGITALVKLIMAASDHMTDLNKALLSGTGFANDFISSAKNYKGVVDELRNAAIDMRGHVMKYGMTSEDVLKTINVFAKESTGSLIKTRDTLKQLGEGDVARGMEEFAETAKVYGQALGMEATEVAGMMGKFVNEAGYGADQVQHLMGNVVKAAATANMPMTKFMDIFRRVIPDVELYQNRIEELTGVVKLLSKTMSAKDVQNFMDAFSKGFKGQDFRSRLKTMLIVGEQKVSGALAKDFQNKAATIAESWKQYGISPEEFTKAMKGGEKGMASLITRAQAAASKKGAVIAGEQISNAMKLAGYEGARQKGGLATATAMRGAGTVATYKILKDLSQRFGTGFDGLNEHVIQQLGISEQQYEALRTTHQSMETWQDMLGKFGKTNSRSMNKALRETIALRKKISPELVDLREATEDDLVAASERSNEEQKETREKAKDLATEQYNITSSISDKLENYIGYLLEKLFQLMQPLLDVVQDILAWLIGDKKTVTAVTKLTSDIKEWNKDLLSRTPQAGAMIDDFSAAIKKEAATGKTGEDLGKSVAADPRVAAALKAVVEGKGVDELSNQLKEMAKAEGMTDDNAEKIADTFFHSMEKGDFSGAMASMKDMPEDMGKNIMFLVQRMIKSDKLRGMIPTSLRTQMTRPGAGPAGKYMSQKEIDEAAERADVEVLDTPAPKPGAAAPGGGFIGMRPGMTPAEQAEVLAAMKGEPPPGPPTTAGVVGPAVATGAPGAAPPPAAQAAADAQQQTADHLEDQGDLTEEQIEKADAQYQAATDTLSLLKKGIRFEQSWMGTKFRNVLKEASLDSLRTALTEQLVGYAKLWDNKDLRDALTEHGDDLMKSGVLKSGFSGFKDTDTLNELAKKAGVPGYQQGGNIPHTGLFVGHAGEHVTSAPNVRAGRGGASGKNFNVVIYAQGTPASQIPHHIGRLARSP